ncbi:class I SAM-dependent methyltransferase [Phytomonospora endophytica]|uniref:SAM-dependent methyltransferase n=1 Tax=Phytomonospora endophytica TaxID=714109 RepID=A0A841FGB2_9ACTN|nr:class I SAM-dependent methyltransferase [Phytomonospora endophytica]MBB6034904.1 SAM-dependent methyltransferase [Phytomonospora endophytica]GIG70608.1 hypothetical protein Pen01_69030 [Phytomonospora endophytica]
MTTHELLRDAALPSLARIDAYDWVLVLGCGIGWTSRRAAHRAHRGQVLGLDARPGMLARARELAAAEELRNLRYADVSGLSAGLGAGDFDVAIVHSGVAWSALTALSRVLVPGGRVVVECEDPGEAAARLSAAGFTEVAPAAPEVVAAVAAG